MGSETKEEGVLTSFVWKFIERGSSQLVAIIIQVILARLLSTDDFGTIAILLVFINLAAVFVQKGFAFSIIRKIQVNNKDYNTCFWISEFIALIFYLILFLASPTIESIFETQDLALYLRVLSITLFFGAISSIENAILTRLMKFKAIFFSGFFANLVSGVIAAIFAMIGIGIWALVMQTIIQQIILSFAMYWFCDWKIKFEVSRQGFREIFAFGSKVLLAELLYTFMQNIRTLAIGKMYSTQQLAFYDRGQTYPNAIMGSLYDTIGSISLPIFAQNQQDVYKLRQKINLGLGMVVLLITPIFVGFAAVAEPFVYTLLTSKWSASVIYIQIFCIYQIPIPIYCLLRQALYAIGLSGYVLKLEIIKGVLFLAAIVMGLFLNPIAIAIATTIAMYISTIIYIIFSYRIIKFNMQSLLKELIRVFIYSIVMAIGISFLNKLNFSAGALLCIDILAGVILYFGCILICKDKYLSLIIDTVVRKIKGSRK